jgi:hypothetical protein
MWDPQHLTTIWASMACYWDSFTFLTKQENILLKRITIKGSEYASNSKKVKEFVFTT